MADQLPLYNSRIIKIYLEYLSAYYPEVNIDHILDYAGIARYEVEDPAYWLTQDQADRFHYIAAKMTRNRNIARDAGRYGTSSRQLGPIRQYALGLMNAASAYLFIEKLYRIMSRGADVKVKKLGSQAVEIIATPRPGVQEKPYQCENRIGLFESLAEFFTGKHARVEHPSCLHKGGDTCRYIVSWEKTPSFIWKRARNFSLIIAPFISVVLFFFLPFAQWSVVAGLALLSILGSSLCYEHLKNRELSRTIETQGDAARRHLEEIDIRYNNARLVQEIGESISRILDIDELARTVVGVMEKHLDFDRGLIMLANEERTRLLYKAGYGYDQSQEKLLRETAFHLDRPDSRGMFVRAFRERQPFLIDDIRTIEGEISERSRDLARRMGVHSLLSVPIVYEGESLGILTVDNVNSKRPFTQSDVSLLTGVASQTALSMTNAIAFQKLRESEKKYRELVENANSIILRRDVEGRITFFNEYAQKFFGYSEREILGRNVLGTIVPERDSRGRNMAAMIRDIGRDPGRFAINENENMRRNGERVWVSWSNRAIRDKEGKVVEILCVGNDITRRRRTEEALKQSEEKYRNILEYMEEGYFEVDLAGNLIFFNDSTCRMLGYGRDELRGMNNRQYMDQANAKRIYRVFNRVYRTGKAARLRNYEIIRKDGAKRILEMSTSLVRNEAGEAVGFRGVVRDVTERIEAEKEKKKLEAKLQRAQKMEAIGTLAGGVAHDLNNILTALVSYPELLLMRLSGDDPMRKPLLTIQKSGEKAAAVVQDLLTLARRGVAVTEVTNLNTIITEYLKSPEHVKLTSFHPDVKVKTELDPSLLNILGSPVHLSKTVMNLISNAAEAMPEGGEILVRTENRYVDRPVSGYDEVREGDYAVLTVADTGVGISPKDMERIFEPFYTKKVMGRSGTGLGMAVVWGTVRDHKGYIDLQSVEGKGTKFILYFPVTRQVAAREGAALSVEEYMGRGESILIVDDVPEQREIATGMLESLGYRVAAVSSGEEAVEYLKDHTSDLVVLDMIMDPGMDGLETYRQILELHPEQRAIIVSGFSESERVKEAQRLGAGAYVKKPYLLEKIGTAVRCELDR